MCFIFYRWFKIDILTLAVCKGDFERFPNQHVHGAKSHPDIRTLKECKMACLDNDVCTGVDWGWVVAQFHLKKVKHAILLWFVSLCLCYHFPLTHIIYLIYSTGLVTGTWVSEVIEKDFYDCLFPRMIKSPKMRTVYLFLGCKCIYRSDEQVTFQFIGHYSCLQVPYCEENYIIMLNNCLTQCIPKIYRRFGIQWVSPFLVYFKCVAAILNCL